MSKERLEDIKEKYNFRSIDRFVDVKLVNPQELKWLIKQAEKVEYWRKQHRKRCNELEDAYFKIQLIENQNKRYKQALETIRNMFPMRSSTSYYKLSRIRKITEKALEGEE